MLSTMLKLLCAAAVVAVSVGLFGVQHIEAIRLSNWGRACKVNLVELIVDPRTGAKIRVDRRVAPFYRRIHEIMQKHNWGPVPKATTGGYNCRNMNGKNTKSYHAYGLAADYDWQNNPQTRRGDLRLLTNMPPAMVQEIREIKTNNGKTAFRWGGDFRRFKDAMHWEIAMDPADAATGVKRNGPPPPVVTCRTPHGKGKCRLAQDCNKRNSHHYVHDRTRTCGFPAVCCFKGRKPPAPPQPARTEWGRCRKHMGKYACTRTSDCFGTIQYGFCPGNKSIGCCVPHRGCASPMRGKNGLCMARDFCLSRKAVSKHVMHKSYGGGGCGFPTECCVNPN